MRDLTRHSEGILGKSSGKTSGKELQTSRFLMVTRTRNAWHSFRGNFLSFDARNDVKVGFRFDAEDHENWFRGKI